MFWFNVRYGVFFCSSSSAPNVSPLDYSDMIRHISVLIGITCFSEHITVNKRLWLMQSTKRMLKEKSISKRWNRRKYFGNRRVANENRWNSALNMDIFLVCLFELTSSKIKCICIMFFFVLWQRPENSIWLQLNILFFKVPSKVFSFLLSSCSKAFPKHCVRAWEWVNIEMFVSIRDSFSMWDHNDAFSFPCVLLLICAYAYNFFPYLVDLTHGSFPLKMQIPLMAGWLHEVNVGAISKMKWQRDEKWRINDTL